MLRTCFKCVENKDGKLTSSLAGGPFEAVYSTEQTTYPPVKDTYLFVFDSLTAAIKWNTGVDEIWECEAEVAEVEFIRGTFGDLQGFWDIYNAEDRVLDDYSISSKKLNLEHHVFAKDVDETPNMLFAKSVRLVRKLA